MASAVNNGDGAANNGDAKYDYDLFAIGAGSGGVRSSRISAGLGARAAVCEMPFAAKASDTRGGVGGTCVLRGCVPKKLLVYASEFSSSFKDSAGFGWSYRHNGGPEMEWGDLIEAKNKELHRLNGVYHRILSNAGVEVIEGRGMLKGPHEVDVDGKIYTAKNIVIATGSRASVPPIPGAEMGITSDDALELSELPKSIVIAGSGYIALEFAGIFAALGVETHLVYRQPHPLRGFDMEVRKVVAENLEVNGIHIHPNSNLVGVKKLKDGRLELETDNGSYIGDKVMFATGRHPNIKHLGLEEAGVETNEKGAIKVDDYSRTSQSSIFAIGDVTDRINLTPVALMEGTAVAQTLFGPKPTEPDHKNVPYAVFCQPPAAVVGMTEEDAAEELGSVDVYTSQFRPMRNTLSGNPNRSFMKILVDPNSDKVVGMHLVGADVPEMLQGFAVAVHAGLTKAQFDATVGIHPTAAEELVTMRTKTRTTTAKKATAAV